MSICAHARADISKLIVYVFYNTLRIVDVAVVVAVFIGDLHGSVVYVIVVIFSAASATAAAALSSSTVVASCNCERSRT